jgi:hypothetical protein
MSRRGRDLVERTMITVDDLVNDGGYLNPEQANTFIKMLVDEPTIMRDMRTVTMPGPQMKINKIGFGQRILRAAPASGTYPTSPDTLSDRGLAPSLYAVPVTDHVDLQTVEVMAEVRLPYDVLEDNIERDRLEQSVMQLIASQTAIDLEELIILGDTDLVSVDPYLGSHDGMLKMATLHSI